MPTFIHMGTWVACLFLMFTVESVVQTKLSHMGSCVQIEVVKFFVSLHSCCIYCLEVVVHTFNPNP